MYGFGLSGLRVTGFEVRRPRRYLKTSLYYANIVTKLYIYTILYYTVLYSPYYTILCGYRATVPSISRSGKFQPRMPGSAFSVHPRAPLQGTG